MYDSTHLINAVTDIERNTKLRSQYVVKKYMFFRPNTEG